jgi:hypothetical protein
MHGGREDDMQTSIDIPTTITLPNVLSALLSTVIASAIILAAFTLLAG